jgi:ATP-dependent Clp protease protease subunit
VIPNFQNVIPMVIESRTRERPDIYSVIAKELPFWEHRSKARWRMSPGAALFLNREDPEKEIQMYINSPGGEITSGFAIYDTMQMITNPISTVAVGMTASFGNFTDLVQRDAVTLQMPRSISSAAGEPRQATDIEIQINRSWFKFIRA